ADAGDNSEIDTDYQQDYLDNGLLDNSYDGEYGGVGVCEPPGGGYIGDVRANPDPNTVGLLAPTQNCGNYYNAPGGDELEIVFDEIASRLFTRLSG
ncbi:MAG: hypothetical protein SF029_05625, partial [bacterium]|nr:hypothetical protein [bacterium]